jgi:putative RNA 2'-phosphotransferase
MKLPRQLEALARMLAYMLGHHPDEFGLVLNEDGSIPVKRLHRALIHEPGWGFVRRHHLDQVVSLLKPPAFEVVAERIRCLKPGPAPGRRPGAVPPPLLYLAIPPKSHERVWQEGLKAAGAGELVLARTKETALKLGRRPAPAPILITIQAQAAAKAGLSFAGYGEELFLAPALPREFLQMPAPPPPSVQPRAAQAPAPPPTPGSFIVPLAEPAPKPHQRRGKRQEPAWKAGTRALRKKRRRED